MTVKLTINLIIVLAIIFFVPGLPPYTELEAVHPTPVRPLRGALDPKGNILNQAEKLFEGKISGPEGLEPSPTDPDVFYATLEGGQIAKIYDNGSKMKIIANLGDAEKCAADVRMCSRPLGIRFDRNGKLIIADSYLGIFSINLENGKISHLVSNEEVINGRTSKFFNSVAPAKDGKLFYTEFSTNYYLHEWKGDFFDAPSGRLMVYDPITKKSKILKENVHMANGVILPPNEEFIIFSEFMQGRLLKYHLTGPKKGKTDVFLDGLPGTPDNLSLTPKGNIFVSLFILKSEEGSSLDFIYSQPWLRKLILRILYLIKIAMNFIEPILEHPAIRDLVPKALKSFSLSPSFPNGSIILEVDWTGEILNSWHSNSSDIQMISEAIIVNDYMYLGSPFNHFLGRIKLSN